MTNACSMTAIGNASFFWETCSLGLLHPQDRPVAIGWSENQGDPVEGLLPNRLTDPCVPNLAAATQLLEITGPVSPINRLLLPDNRALCVALGFRADLSTRGDRMATILPTGR